MMIKKLILIALIVMLPVVVTGFFWSSRAMSIRVNKKDLPEHGLTIIGPTDPSFQGKMSALMRGNQDIPAEAIKPFSIFVKNVGKRTVVGYGLKWDLTKPDGETVTYRNTTINPETLMGIVDPGSEASKKGGVIKPLSTRHFSPLSTLNLEADDSQSGMTGAFRDQSLAQQAQSSLQTGDRAAFFNALSMSLPQYTNITVSIDWAIFEDGTFVGSDTSGFFAKFEAQRNAKYDLLAQMRDDLAQGKSFDDVFNQLQTAANKPAAPLLYGSSPDAYYSFFQRLYAREILSIRSSQGDERAVKYTLKSLNKSWPTLRKM